MNALLALQTMFVWTFDGGGGAVTAAAVIGLGVLLLAWALRGVPAASQSGRPTPFSGRERSGQIMFVRQRDPDRAGRARPRAPSAGPAPV